MASLTWAAGSIAALLIATACQNSVVDADDGQTASSIASDLTDSTGVTTDATGDSPVRSNPGDPTTIDATADVRSFGATGDGETDDTAAIQAAIDQTAEAGGGTVRFPVGRYRVTQLEWRRGVNLIGDITGRGGDDLGSEIVQADGATDSLIVSDPGLSGDEYFHWSAMENLRLTGAADGSGRDGVTVRSRTGENFRIHRVLASGFPRHGIALTRGGAPTTISDIHVFGNGEAGVYITRSGRDRYQTFRAELISGDDNGLALLLLEGVGGAEELFYIDGLKIESSIEGRQPYGVVLDDTNVAHVFIRDASAIATGDGSMIALVAVRGSDARFWLEGFRRSDDRVAAVIVDEVRDTTFSEFGDLALSYSSGAVRYRIGPSSITDAVGRELRPVEAGQGVIGDGETTATVPHDLGPDAVIALTPRGAEQIWIEFVGAEDFTVRRAVPAGQLFFEWIGSVS